MISDPKSEFQQFWDISILIRIFESVFSPPLRLCFMQDFGERFVVRSGLYTELLNQLASTVEPEPPHNCSLRDCGRLGIIPPHPKIRLFFHPTWAPCFNKYFLGCLQSFRNHPGICIAEGSTSIDLLRIFIFCLSEGHFIRTSTDCSVFSIILNTYDEIRIVNIC